MQTFESQPTGTRSGPEPSDRLRDALDCTASAVASTGAGDIFEVLVLGVYPGAGCGSRLRRDPGGRRCGRGPHHRRLRPRPGAAQLRVCPQRHALRACDRTTVPLSRRGDPDALPRPAREGHWWGRLLRHPPVRLPGWIHGADGGHRPQTSARSRAHRVRTQDLLGARRDRARAAVRRRGPPSLRGELPQYLRGRGGCPVHPRPRDRRHP